MRGAKQLGNNIIAKNVQSNDEIVITIAIHYPPLHGNKMDKGVVEYLNKEKVHDNNGGKVTIRICNL